MLDSMVMQTQGTLKVELRSKRQSLCEITNKQQETRFWIILIRKSCGKSISKKYSILELRKVTFNYRRHDKPNHILFANI
jgi:hypothetical protein